MSAKQLLKNYTEAIKMSDSSPLILENVILDILKYLTENEDKYIKS